MISERPTDFENALPRQIRGGQRRWVGRGLIFLGCVLLLDGLLGDRGLAQSLKVRQDVRRTADDVVRLKRDNAALRDQVQRLRSDPLTLEAAARRQLGLIRPGEILVVLKDVQ